MAERADTDEPVMTETDFRKWQPNADRLIDHHQEGRTYSYTGS
jgi:hypothetical protein